MENLKLYERISTFSFDEGGPAFPFVARLAKENGWPENFAVRVLEEYRRFVYLAMTAGHAVAPSEQVDQAWHQHLLYTRSYWERFCGGVLDRPLHHEPTEGGSEEQAKFKDWYAATLSSYRKAFGDPPADIWPNAEVRFGDDLFGRRVNTKHNWIVPRRWVFRGGVAAAAGALAGLITGL